MSTIQSMNGVRNGVDTTTLFATLDAVKAAPAAAQFKFRASNRWISGTHSQSTIDGFFGVGEERAHEQATTLDVDHPKVLVGSDQGPTPVEYLLHGLAGCLTAGLANIAAARGIELTEVSSTVEGDIDLNGILGLEPRRPQRVLGHPRRLRREGQRPRREARVARRAVPGPVRGVRRADQRRPGVDRGQRRLTAPRPVAAPSPRGHRTGPRPEPRHARSHPSHHRLVPRSRAAVPSRSAGRRHRDAAVVDRHRAVRARDRRASRPGGHPHAGRLAHGPAPLRGQRPAGRHRPARRGCGTRHRDRRRPRHQPPLRPLLGEDGPALARHAEVVAGSRSLRPRRPLRGRRSGRLRTKGRPSSGPPVLLRRRRRAAGSRG